MRLISITGVATVAGSGAVSVATTMPVDYGSLLPNQESTQQVLFDWPSTATRIRFTLGFAANDGSYIGSTVLTIFR